MSNYAKEERLTGNVSSVYRSENTVRRELKPGSEKIHKLLQHLENKGFHYAPKFLGVDERIERFYPLLKEKLAIIL